MGLLAAAAGISLGFGQGSVPMVVAGGVVAIVLGLAPGLGRQTIRAGAVLLALLALYLRYTGHTSTPFPAVDWIRPRGMDVWPGLLQAMGMVLLLATAPAVLRGSGGRGIRAGALAGCVLSVAYWFFPQHFVIDELVPATEGRATMPVVVEGRIEPRSWGRAGVPGTPITALPEILDNEQRLAAIAHGMGHEAARLAGQSAGGQLRSTLWWVQRAATPVVLWAGVLSMGVSILVVLGLVRRGPTHPILRRGAVGVLGLALLGPPIINLGLRLAGIAGGLPEARDAMLSAFVLAGSMLGLGLVTWMAGHALCARAGGEE